MLEKIIELTNEYIESMPKKERKKYGQFFTSMETARFMSGLYNFDEKTGKVSNQKQHRQSTAHISMHR